MKKLILILLLFSISNVYCQITDTIEVSYTKTAYLIFPDEPEIDAGSEDVLTRVHKNKVIIQAAVEGFEETNLFVQCGARFYVFILKYTTKPQKYLFNYQIDKENKTKIINETVLNNNTISSQETDEALTTALDAKLETPAKTNELIDYSVREDIKEKNIAENDKMTTLKNNCIWLESKTQDLFNKGIAENKISFVATNFYVQDDYFYLKTFIVNKSKIKYDIDFIRFTLKSVKKSIKKAADQYIELTPVYKYNEINNVPGKEKDYIIFVFKKFTIENNKRFNIEMWEKSGDRKLDFDFLSEDILKIKRID